MAKFKARPPKLGLGPNGTIKMSLMALLVVCWFLTTMNLLLVKETHSGDDVIARGLQSVPKNDNVVFPKSVQPLITRYQVHAEAENPLPMQELQEVMAHSLVTPGDKPNHAINHIYYNNLDKNVKRRHIMDTFLQRVATNTGVNFTRLPAHRGTLESCQGEYKSFKCVGLSGLAHSLLSILKNEAVDSDVLVLEDDFIFYEENLDRLDTGMSMVPNDWDIVRLDCWGMHGKVFASHINPFLTNTTTAKPSNHCIESGPSQCSPVFYGGTHGMVWRGRASSVRKLIKTWSKMPMDHVDARLATVGGPAFGLVSYCLNIGMGPILSVPSEETDIQDWGE